MNKKKVSGLVMAVTGLIILLLNALNYLFGWNWSQGAATVPIGVMLAVIGAMMVRNSAPA
jgi:hypothetical protein